MPSSAFHAAATVCLRRLAVAVLACVAGFGGTAQAAEPEAWKLDPVHTRVVFAVSHAGFSSAIGTVSGSEGGLLYTPGEWDGARLVVEVPITRLDLGDADWNRAALAPNLLDGDTYPTARFVSNTVTALDPRRAEVCGDLTLRGVTRPLCMQVTANAAERHPMPPFRQTAGFSATATLSRSAHGLDAWPSMIGDTVELRIEAEATRASRSFAERLFGEAQAGPTNHDTTAPGEEP